MDCYSVFELRTSVSIANQNKSCVSLYCCGGSLCNERQPFLNTTASTLLFSIPSRLALGLNHCPSPRLTNQRLACPTDHTERFPWHAAFIAIPFLLYFACPTSVSILWTTCVYIHTSECMETVYELTLLPNNAASETFLHKSVAMRSVDWILVIGAPSWRWLGEYKTVDKTFYNALSKQEVVAAPVTSTFSPLSYSFGRQD